MVLPPAFERLCPFLFIVAYKPTRKLLNLDSLISHLTNSNLCSNIWVRFPLIVSPTSPHPFAIPLPVRCCSRVTGHEPQVTPFHQVADSLFLPKKSTPLQSSKSSLFCQNT